MYGGIDPGKFGALAVVENGRVVEVEDMPLLDGVVDPLRLVRWCEQMVVLGVGHWVVERVHSMPRQGVASSFGFGMSYGMVLGAVAASGAGWTLVRPIDWKRFLSVPKSKDGARARASQIMPGCATLWPRVKDDGRAEAALLALYGERKRL